MSIRCNRNCMYAAGGACQNKEIEVDVCGVCRTFVEQQFQRDDNVVILDNTGMPSIMVRFTRNPEVKPHPMFLIDGEVYDEVYISKYKNCVINGLAYSLPMQKPATALTLEEAEKACFNKGEGWHLLTAAEWGYLANESFDRGTLPHGNTQFGKWYQDFDETCGTYDNCRMLTGTGPRTWRHDHTTFGVEGLNGDLCEWVRGMRLVNGRLETCGGRLNNDAAAPFDLSGNSGEWNPVRIDGDLVYLDMEDGAIHFTTKEPDYGKEPNFGQDMDFMQSCAWENVVFDIGEGRLKDLLTAFGFFPGESHARIKANFIGERPMTRGCEWHSGDKGGMFNVKFLDSQDYYSQDIGFRSAYYKKKTGSHRKDTADTVVLLCDLDTIKFLDDLTGWFRVVSSFKDPKFENIRLINSFKKDQETVGISVGSAQKHLAELVREAHADIVSANVVYNGVHATVSVNCRDWILSVTGNKKDKESLDELMNFLVEF